MVRPKKVRSDRRSSRQLVLSRQHRNPPNFISTSMAAPVVRRVGRRSHTILLLAEGPPLPLEQPMEAAREAVRNDLSTRQLGREPDAIATAVVTARGDSSATMSGFQSANSRWVRAVTAWTMPSACSSTTSEPVWKPWMCGNLVSHQGRSRNQTLHERWTSTPGPWYRGCGLGHAPLCPRSEEGMR